MKQCENEYLGYCLTCGSLCKEVELCSETMVGIHRDKIDKNWVNKSLKERYEIIEKKLQL